MAYPLNLDNLKKGDWPCKIKAEDLVTLANMLNGLTVEMVHNQDYAEVVSPTQDGRGWKLKIPWTSSGTNYDYVYVGGKKLTPPTKTTNFLKVYLDGTTTPEWVSAMPETQDSNAEVFDVTKNRIHLPANFGGG